MWNQGAITAGLALFGVMLGAGLQYISGRALEGRKELSLQRSQAYADFFKAIALVAQYGASKDNLAMAADAKVRVCIYGSPRVIRLLGNFEMSGPVLDSAEAFQIVTELLKEMRKDTGMDCRGIEERDLQNILFGPKRERNVAANRLSKRPLRAFEEIAIPKRHRSVSGTYFVTSKTWEARAIFQATRACEIFMESLLHYRDEGAYKLHAFVLMRDHFHLLLTPGEETSLERAVQFIKGGSAKTLRDELKFSFPVWQRGFTDHRIRDAADYDQHAAYIAKNPVKRHLVEEAREYPWSSASGNFAMDDVPQGLKPLSLSAATRHG